MITPNRIAADRVNRGFTLIELLVSMAILAMIVMVMVSMVGQTTSIWSKTTGKVEQFRGARDAYELMTRRLSQATLNTYWGYDDAAKPTKYVRQAELRYISGRKLATAGGTARPTHAVFFFAPLGFVEQGGATPAANAKYRGLDYLLNTCGFFIEYNDDAAFKPTFVNSPPRKRFRLIESLTPTQNLVIYDPAVQAKPGNTGWIYGNTAGWGYNSTTAHVLAENVVALILLPKLSKSQIQSFNASGSKKYDEYSLCPPTSYFYTTSGMELSYPGQMTDPRVNPNNQLPPVVQVVMVSIDEASAARMSDADNDALLKKVDTLFITPSKLEADLNGDPLNPSKSEATDSLTEYLIRKRINYRVFNTDVSIRGAKWSTEQTK